MTILAIDPGPTQSAYVLWDGARVIEHHKLPNDELLQAIELGEPRPHTCVIERIASMGMAVGAEVFETCVWTGRFMQAYGPGVQRITRGEVKMHLCCSMRAKDANIRQAILDRFGGKVAAIGSKRQPGPLYGLAGDEWAALAVALTWWDKHEAELSATGD